MAASGVAAGHGGSSTAGGDGGSARGATGTTAGAGVCRSSFTTAVRPTASSTSSSAAPAIGVIDVLPLCPAVTAGGAAVAGAGWEAVFGFGGAWTAGRPCVSIVFCAG